jgi:hypothetical protein
VDAVRGDPARALVGGEPAAADRVEERQRPRGGLRPQPGVEREQRRRDVVVHPERADDDDPRVRVRHAQAVERQPRGGHPHRYR